MIFCFSCEKEDAEIDSNNSNVENLDFEVVKISASQLRSAGNEDAENDEYALKFRNEDSYNKLMSQLELMTEDERLNWNKKLTNFNSMAQEYEKAMEEAESYCDRAGGYEEFKEKYNNLYFPEEGNDFAAYIPFENELLSFCANENGHLVVGEEIKNLETINNYDQLVKSGRGMVDKEPTEYEESKSLRTSVLKSATSGMPTMDELKKRSRIDAVFLTPGTWWFDKLVIGNERWQHSTGWRTYGDRKIKLDFRRETRTNYWLAALPGGLRLEWHFEVSFRKKGFLGKWYNYSSRTQTSVNIQYFNESGDGISSGEKMYLSESGTSSHDMWKECTVFRYIQPQSESWANVYKYDSKSREYSIRCLYLMPAYWADFTIRYQGIGNELKFAFSAPALFGFTRYTTDKLGWGGPI